jgi:acyl-coenzyme A thioesterase PaaI-like protein
LAAVSIKDFNLDDGYVESQLKVRPTNKNYFGTHFGGSLYSMCDPWYVFILAHKIGKEYIIWDVEASIKFKKAVKDPVTARFEISDEQAKAICDEAQSGETVLPEFKTTVQTKDGTVVAEVFKKLYVKKKK